MAAADRKRFLLFPSVVATGWRVVRRVSLERGLREEERGNWRRVLDQTGGNLIGFQMIEPEASRGDVEILSIRSMSAITFSDIMTNAGLRGASRTARMNDEQRAMSRVPEDRVERIVAKVNVYPRISAAKGDILRVWPR